MDLVPYDEFSLFHENAAEAGLAFDGPPLVRRDDVALPDGRHLSALVWGDESPRLALLHGGAQNAHTWDTVMLALGRPAVCVDLPGHGHSGAPAGDPLDVTKAAADVRVALAELAPPVDAIVGMSFGGLTTLALAESAPDLICRLMLVDITPGVTAEKSRAIADFVNGPESFASFDELLARTIEHNPTRSPSSLRRGILHNAEQRPDGSWVWRHARHRVAADFGAHARMPHTRLWDVVESTPADVMLVRGMRSQSVVSDDEETELLRRRSDARVAHVDSGHSVQGDAPLELAALIDGFVFGAGPVAAS
ncbi:alpha/beta hydrolase [soil metagenome]